LSILVLAKSLKNVLKKKDQRPQGKKVKKVYLLIFCSLIISFFSGILSKHTIVKENSLSIRCDYNGAARDTESCFALGQQIDFSSASTYDLQLIPGISDARSAALLENRSGILEYSRANSGKEAYEGFTTVHGIGEKTAETLGKYLSLAE